MAQSPMLAGKVVAVTGAGGGIGREIALLAAREGACVVVNDVGASCDGQGTDATPAEDVVSLIRKAGGQAVVNVASVTEEAGARSIITDAVQHFGRLDVVVNNAGILRDRMFTKMTLEDWQAVMAVHAQGSFLVSRAAADLFKDQGGGAYVHFTSTSGLIGAIGQANYAAAKMAIVGLSTSIALEMQRYQVRSNCIAPFAWSRMLASIPARTPEEQAMLEKMKSMSADKIAPLVVFLGSDAARDVNGQIFCVRKNEIFLIAPPRPIRALHRAEGWTPQSIAQDMLPSFKSSLVPLVTGFEMFNYDPV